MATKPKASTSTAVVTWDEQLARDAVVAAAQEESTATGQFFSLKSGVLSFNDNPVPGNEMVVVILDTILENVYYEGKYDSDNPQGPKCFAFGRVEKEMAPHKITFENKTNMSDLCDTCEMNEWGSAETGRGKACRNTRRLAMIPGGTLEGGQFKPFKDTNAMETTGLAYLKLPVTSVKSYAAFVKQVVGALKRPPHGIFTKISVKPDPKTQFRVNFEAVAPISDDFMEVIMRRNEEAKASIDFPYTPFDPEEAPPPPKRGAKAAAPVGRAKRY